MMERPRSHRRAWTIALGTGILSSWPAASAPAFGVEHTAAPNTGVSRAAAKTQAWSLWDSTSGKQAATESARPTPGQPTSAPAPITQAPITQAPITQAPITQAPTTQARPAIVPLTPPRLNAPAYADAQPTHSVLMPSGPPVQGYRAPPVEEPASASGGGWNDSQPGSWGLPATPAAVAAPAPAYVPAASPWSNPAATATLAPPPLPAALPEESPEFTPAPAPVSSWSARPNISAAAPRAKAAAADSPLIRRAETIARNGFALAQRGMSYSAKAEFIQSLRLTSQALDAQTGGASHGAALLEAFRALEEADDFASSGSQLEIDVARVAQAHRTPVLKGVLSRSMTPLAAMQAYYQFAQERLAAAGGQEPAASLALYGLGKLHLAMSESGDEKAVLGSARAMAFHQAALAVDPRNHLAGNELGVLLARCEQLSEARTALQQSLSSHPTAEAWHNLAVVHERLGESDLAKRAQFEHRRLASQPGPPPSSVTNNLVQWTDPQTFTAAQPAASALATPAQAAVPGKAAAPARTVAPAKAHSAAPMQAKASPAKKQDRPWWQWWDSKR